MKFEWDEASNRANIGKYALDFADAEEMFRGLRVVDPTPERITARGAGLESARFARASCIWSSRSLARIQFASSH